MTDFVIDVHNLQKSFGTGKVVDGLTLRRDLRLFGRQRHREVLIEAELLRHVAGLAADQRGLADDVVHKALAASAIGYEQPDGCGFAAV